MNYGLYTDRNPCTDKTIPCKLRYDALNVCLTHDSHVALQVCVVTGGGNNLVVGWCCVGAAESAAEGRHWAQMAHETRKAVAMWHTLR